MLANFKGRQNTNGFANNSQNINKKGRPPNYYSFLLKDAIETGDLTKGLSIALQYALSKKKVSLKELFGDDAGSSLTYKKVFSDICRKSSLTR